jgi:MFS family permease
MYISVRQPPGAPRPEPPATTLFRWPRVSRNVVLLGFTSMFTDVSSEMVNAVLPIYLTFQLRFPPLAFGVFIGLYQAMTALLSLAGGLLADRTRRHKEVATAGYAVSAACKLGLLASANAWLPTTAILFLDRTGKGVRTAPRDALISLSSPTERLGEAFGVHRALDTAGALLGPVAAFAILALAPGAYDAIFVASFCVALIGLGVLILFVENRRSAPAGAALGSVVSLRTALSLLRMPRFRVLVGAGAVLGLLTIGDAFVYLTFQHRSQLNTSLFPLLYVGTALGYLLLALPLGRLADRIGRARVFVGGQLLLLLVYALLLFPRPGAASLVGILALLGAYYAATDGVLMALAAATISPTLRTSGMAVIQSTGAIGRLGAAALFGALWSWQGPETALAVVSAGLLTALPITAVALGATRREAAA